MRVAVADRYCYGCGRRARGSGGATKQEPCERPNNRMEPNDLATPGGGWWQATGQVRTDRQQRLHGPDRTANLLHCRQSCI